MSFFRAWASCRHPSACEPGSVRYMQNRWLAREYLSLFGKGVAMKKSDVKIGGIYAAKVSDKIVPVKIEAVSPLGGWSAVNLMTRKKVHIKSPARLRYPCDRDGAPSYAAIVGQEAPSGPSGEHKAEAQAQGAKKQKRAPRAKRGASAGKLSGLDAAAKVLAEATEPLDCRTIVERAFAKGYWQSEGKTPAATIYSAVIREIAAKGDAARFRKAARGKFELAR